MTDSERLHCEAADYADDRMDAHKKAGKKQPEEVYKGNWIAHYEGYIAGYNAKKREKSNA
jgi:hypothetical protein